jgi:hypothetical protein
MPFIPFLPLLVMYLLIHRLSFAGGSRINMTGVLTSNNQGSFYSINVQSDSATFNLLKTFSSTVAGGACAVEDDIIRSLVLREGRLQLVNFNTSEKSKMSFIDLSNIGFITPTVENMKLGVDWYLTSGRNVSDVFIGGGDSIGFLHMLNYEMNGDFSDIFEYGQGSKLSYSNSAFDHINNQLWIQTVFNTNTNFSTANINNSKKYDIYVKQYDLTTNSLLNIVKDPSNAQVIVSANNRIYTIGQCNTTSDVSFNYTTTNTCLWSLDPSQTIPIFTKEAELSKNWDKIMASVFSISDDVLQIIVRVKKVKNQVEELVEPLVCNEASVCHRTRDATSFAGEGWSVASVDLKKMAVTNTILLSFPGSFDKTSKLAC